MAIYKHRRPVQWLNGQNQWCIGWAVGREGKYVNVQMPDGATVGIWHEAVRFLDKKKVRSHFEQLTLFDL